MSTDANVDLKRRRKIEKAAKDAVLKANADAMILGPLVDRLDLWHDGKLGEGDDSFVVRARGNASKSPDDVLNAMRSEAQFAEYFTDAVDPVLDPERDADAYEAQTVDLIQAAIAKLAPNGNELLVSPSTKISIARRIRAERGGKPAILPSPHRRERSKVEAPVNGDLDPMTATDRLKAERRKAWEQDHPAPAPHPVEAGPVGKLKQLRREQHSGKAGKD